MPEPIDLAYAIGLAPKDAIAYFESKGYVISWNWYDVWQEAHAVAFTVAKAAKLEVLQAIRDAAQQALAEGETLTTFSRKLEPKLKSLGWWGEQVEVDPNTGEILKRWQAGSPWRLKTIYQTNTQTAYSAGRWKAGIENADNEPYGMYVAVMDRRTRPAHAALNGKVWRLDSPVWDVIAPPNGFGCRCRLRFLAEDQAQDRNPDSDYTVIEREMPVGTDPEGNPIMRTQRGIRTQHLGRETDLWADVGWDYNPGAAKWGGPDPRKFDADLFALYKESGP